MRFIYDILLFGYNAIIAIAAFSGNRKAKNWVEGRINWEENIRMSLKNATGKRVWIHCASLGEFEQGRQLIEKIKANNPGIFIVLSFFSPSGFEVRKNYQYADYVCYLPVDTRKNARLFIEILSPCCAIFIKYEFWVHYFEELNRKEIPLYVVSAIFRPTQLFFKWYGSFYRSVLKNVSHFFVQDEVSYKLLSKEGFNNISITGDTRFDRVVSIAREKKTLEMIEKFKSTDLLFIAGSTWPEDEEVIFPVLHKLRRADLKIVIAPHEVSEKRIDNLMKASTRYFKKEEVVKYSSGAIPMNSRVLIIDNIGLLSAIYGYGTIGWIGGGFGKGIHNILEAAAFGIPVIIGPNYTKFREATELIEAGGAFVSENRNMLMKILTELLNDREKLIDSGKISSNYVNSHQGATEKILSMLPEIKL